MRTLLIVDDEEDIRFILKSYADKNNIPTLEASSGSEAFEMIKTNPNITAIFSDVNMPNGNGHELLNKVRGLGLFTPFVFITACDAKHDLHEALKLGAFDFVSKPFNSAQVIDLMFKSLDVGAAIDEALRTESKTPEVVAKVVQIERLLKKLSLYGRLK